MEPIRSIRAEAYIPALGRRLEGYLQVWRTTGTTFTYTLNGRQFVARAGQFTTVLAA